MVSLTTKLPSPIYRGSSENAIEVQSNAIEVQSNAKVVWVNALLTTVHGSTRPRKYLLPLLKRLALSLENQDDLAWTAEISIGSNNQMLTIEFDTGSSDLWVPFTQCSGCDGHSTYNPKASTTSKFQGMGIHLMFGNAVKVSGPVFSDTVKVGGITVTNQSFAAAVQLSDYFSGQPHIDGILGLAIPSAPIQLGHPQFFQNAFQQHAISQNEFAIKLAASGSELFLGGTNQNLYDGSFEFHNVNPSQGFWEPTGAELSLDGQTILSGFDTIIDSGTALIIGPYDDVAKLYATINGSSQYDATSGLFTFPCSSVPDVAFSWEQRKKWNISAENFNIGQTAPGSGQCVGAIMGQERDGWVLGDSFMKNIYTVFSFAQNTVGFATLK